ncbi:MAG: Spy/CpxP family protein refolding chaperone [SAR324 cluster bacterium]
MKSKHGLWKRVGGGLATVAALAVIGAASTGHAQPFHGRWSGGPEVALGGILHGLDLTADQRHQIAAILRTHKNELVQARHTLSAAATSMMEGVTDQDTTPKALQAKMDGLADAGKQLGRVWLTVRLEAIALLSPEQKQELARRQQRFLRRIEARSSEHSQDQERNIDKLIERLSR